MRRMLPGVVLTLLLLAGCGGNAPLSVQQQNGAAAVSGSQSGPVRTYFTTPNNRNSKDDPNNPARVLAGYIQEAKQTIDVCGYEINNTVIVDALTKAIQRGVKVRVVTDSDNINASGITMLKAMAVPVVDDQR